MDLVLSDDLASDDERAAVDAVLGAATSGWSGGERTEADGRVARGGHEAREQRHLLLPVLHALQSSAGWISPGGLRYVCERLTVPPAEAYGVATFYAMFSVEPRPTTVLHLCDDIACKVAGAEGLIDEVIATGRFASRSLRSPCLGMCERAPAALLQGSGSRDVAFGPVSIERLDPFLHGGPWTMMSGAEVMDVAPQTDGDARGAPAAPPGRRRRSGLARRLPGARWVRGAPAGGRARSRGRDPRAQGLEAPRARRRRVPRGREVGGGREAAGPTPLLRLQRRRIRARHVQGPGPDGARPVRRPRVAHDRRVRDGFGEGVHLHPRRVPARDLEARARDRAGVRARVPRGRRDGGGVRVRRRAPARRRRLHLRRGDLAVQLDRGQARRAPQQAAVPGRARRVRQADRDQQRRDARERARGAHARRRGVRGDRDARLDRAPAVLPLRLRRAPRRVRGRARHHAPRAARDGRRRPGRQGAEGDPARRCGGVVRHAGRPRPAAHVRGLARRRGSRSGRAS